MFNYLLKNIPAEYAFAGYNVRKSLTIMTSLENGKVIYDVFLFTYVDNYLSFYLLMEDGNYKCVDKNISVPPVDANELVSRHIFRGDYYDTTNYDMYDKDKIIGVYGLRKMEDLLGEVDVLNDELNREVRIQALIDAKPSYTGIEINSVISMFNKTIKYKKEPIIVPPIKNGPTDTYPSLIGDEFDYYDFLSGKSADDVVRAIQEMNKKLDGVGNIIKEPEVLEENNNQTNK